MRVPGAAGTPSAAALRSALAVNRNATRGCDKARAPHTVRDSAPPALDRGCSAQAVALEAWARTLEAAGKAPRHLPFLTPIRKHVQKRGRVERLCYVYT